MTDVSDKVNKIQELISIDRITILRSAVSAIPMVGGSLDHLIFDRFDNLRMEKIELSIKHISKRLESIQDNNVIDKDWFETEEFLKLFISLTQKVSVEPDKNKVKSLSYLLVELGKKKFSTNNKKEFFFDLISNLSYFQMKLLQILSQIPESEQTLKTRLMEQKIKGIFLYDILKKIHDNFDNKPNENFWEGQINITLELDTLVSRYFLQKNIIIGEANKFDITISGQKIQLTDNAYFFTTLGKESIKYLEEIDFN